MNILFSYVNLWKTAGLTASSQSQDFPVSYLQTEYRSLGWRSLLIDPAQYVTADLGVAPTGDQLIAVFNHNFTPTGTFKFLHDDNSAFSSPTEIILDHHSKSLVQRASDLQRYQRLHISNNLNTASYFTSGIVWSGPVIELNGNYEWEWEELFQDTTEKARGRVGQQFVDIGNTWRRIPLDFVTDEQDRLTMINMFEVVKTARPFVTVMEHDNWVTGDKQRLTIYGRFFVPPPFKQLFLTTYDFHLEIEEDVA